MVAATETTETTNGQGAIANTTVVQIKGVKATVDAVLTLPSALDYINYQIKAMPPNALGSVPGESFGEQVAAEWIIRKSYRVISTDVLKGLGLLDPPPALPEAEAQGFESKETEETAEEDEQPGRSLTPGLLDALGIEADEFGALLRLVIGIEGDVTYNDLSEEDVEGGRGIGDSNDFTYRGKRIRRLPIHWTETLKIQKSLLKQPRQTYINLFTKYFTINDEPLTFDALKDPNPDRGLGVKLGILIFLRLGKFLNKS